jgi:non-ribosomal peptide synthetase component F
VFAFPSVPFPNPGIAFFVPWLYCTALLLRVNVVETHPQREGSPRNRLPDFAPDPSPDSTLPRLFIETAIARSESLALLGSEGALRYGDLLLRAQNVAVALRRAHVAPGELVGIVDRRSFASVAGLLGILLAGAVYVPFAPNTDKAHLRQQTAASDIHLLLDDTSAAPAHPLPPLPGLRVIDLARVERETMPPFADIQLPPSAPESPAAVLFEDGMHGVLITHRGIARIACAGTLWPLHTLDTVLQHTPWTEHGALLELWAALLHGSALVLLSDADPAQSTRSALRRLRAVLARYSITALSLPAETLCTLAAAAPGVPAGLRHLLLSGSLPARESLHAAVSAAWAAAPGLQIAYACGAPETTSFALAWPFQPDPSGLPTLASAHPVEGAWASVVDATGRPMPHGEPGRLALGGELLALGYLGEPGRTRGRFLAHLGRPASLDQRIFILDTWGRRLSNAAFAFGREPAGVAPGLSPAAGKSPGRVAADACLAPRRSPRPIWHRLLRRG